MLSTSGRVSPNLWGACQSPLSTAWVLWGWVLSPRPHHLDKGADRAWFGDDVCSAGIHIRHNNDWPAESEKTLKGLEVVSPGLVIPRDIVDLEVSKIGGIYL